MIITVVGLGYVGTVAAACLAESGHDVHVVDINQEKVDKLNAGECPIVESGLQELVSTNVARQRLSASTDLGKATRDADVVIVCVGTPTGANGDARLDDLDNVLGEIGRVLTDVGWRLFILTSTVPPGTTESRVIPALESASGKRCGSDFGVAFSPEFLREGQAVNDYQQPAKTVIGASDDRSMAQAVEVFRSYASEIIKTSIATAELVKLTDNAWHALKVVFANEIGRLCAAVGADSHEVMDIFKADTRLNISTAYLTPGFAFGGSCLPKDLRTVVYRARVNGVEVPVLESVLGSNRSHLDLVIRHIEGICPRRIALLGLAFKPGTDDLRESPAAELAARLIGKGFDVVVHDDLVHPDSLIGSNREHALSTFSQVAPAVVGDLRAAIQDADLVVVAQPNPLYARVLEEVHPGQTVLDLCGVARPAVPTPNYSGLLW